MTLFPSSNLFLSFLALLNSICSCALSVHMSSSIVFYISSVTKYFWLAIFSLTMATMFWSSILNTTCSEPCPSLPSPIIVSSHVFSIGNGSTSSIAVLWASPYCSSNNPRCSLAMMMTVGSFFFFVLTNMTTHTSMTVHDLLFGTKACPSSLAHFSTKNFPIMVKTWFIKLFPNLHAFRWKIIISFCSFCIMHVPELTIPSSIA